MNILLPLFLLIVANLVLYWIFFGKSKFEEKIQAQIEAKELEGKKISSNEHNDILNLTNRKLEGIFGNDDARFSKDKLVISEKIDTKNKKGSVKK